MKIILFIIGLVLITNNLKAQIEYLEIDFKPSFKENSLLSIEKEGKHYSLNLKKSTILEKVKIRAADIASLEKFFESYHFKQTGPTDTVITTTINTNGDTIISEQILIGFDGTIIEGKVELKSKTKIFKFWSPRKSSENHQLIELLFNLMNENFKKSSTINYLEDLEQCFRFGLGLKKMSDVPLKYKLYGSISSNEAEELYHFFESIPTTTSVYIDLSNFQGMGRMFDEDFLELIESKPNVYFIDCSKAATKILERIKIEK